MFSARPPTKTVLQPRGRSLVVGSGAWGLGGSKVQVLRWIGSLVGCVTLPITPGTRPNYERELEGNNLESALKFYNKRMLTSNGIWELIAAIKDEGSAEYMFEIPLLTRLGLAIEKPRPIGIEEASQTLDWELSTLVVSLGSLLLGELDRTMMSSSLSQAKLELLCLFLDSLFLFSCLSLMLLPDAWLRKRSFSFPFSGMFSDSWGFCLGKQSLLIPGNLWPVSILPRPKLSAADCIGNGRPGIPCPPAEDIKAEKGRLPKLMLWPRFIPPVLEEPERVRRERR